MNKPLTFLAAGLLGAAALRAADPASAAGPDQDLAITSVGPMVSVTKEPLTTITFHDAVEAKDSDLRVTCDFLQVVVDSRGKGAAPGGQPAKFKSMLATGHVAIYRGTDIITCGRGEISENEDTIILSENPIVTHTKDGSTETPGPHGKLIYLRSQGEVQSVPAPGERTETRLGGFNTKSLNLSPGTKPAAAPPAPAP